MRVNENKLKSFVEKTFEACGLDLEKARFSSDVILLSDKRGIHSHGVIALPRYVNGFYEGKIIADAKMEILKEGSAFTLYDANGMMGMASSHIANANAIEKASKSGIAISVVRNSNHFGIGGYYTLESCKNNMIGLAFTNTARIGIPLFGLTPMFGTNPISFSAPMNKDRDFTLDMSTTIVTRGFVSSSEKEGKKIPEGLAINSKGELETDPKIILECLENGTGGLLPLGGNTKETAGHKGFGLALMVDILTGILGDFLFGKYLEDTHNSATRMAHSFIAIDISKFTDLEKFKNKMDLMVEDLKNSKHIKENHVRYPGEEARKNELLAKKLGIEISEETYHELKKLAETLKLNFDI